MNKKRKILMSLCVLIVLLVLLYSLTLSMGRSKVKPAKLYVNGKLNEMPAHLYWRGKTALVAFPFFKTLEGLGCQVEPVEQSDNYETLILTRDRIFKMKSDNYSSELYENEKLLYSDVARPTRHGKRGVKGQLYLDDRNYREILKEFGFVQIKVEIDEESLIVWLTAEQEWQ